MAVLTDSLLFDSLLVLVPLLYLVYWYLKTSLQYWDNKGIPNIKFGFLLSALIGKQSQTELCLEMYNKNKDRYSGFYQFLKPVLMVRDPDLINKMLIKDFVHFQDRGNPYFKKDPLGMSLFNLRGHVWRALRHKLTPTFSTGKLRLMFDQISNSGDNMMEKIEQLVQENKAIESKPFLFEFTLDVICSCAFGLQIEPNSSDFNTFKSTVEKMFSPSVINLLKFGLALTCPKMADLSNLKSFTEETTEYFVNLTKANLKYRQENDIQRNDYFQLLIKLKEQEETGKDVVVLPSDTTDDDAVINQLQYTEQVAQPSSLNIKLMTEDSIAANSFIFLTAGSESTANTTSFTLLNLAQHPDIQQRLQQEVDSALKQRGGWSYDTIKDMTYMDQVIQETQRLYPLISMLLRECVLPFKMPESDLVIEKGVMIGIPVAGLQRDPQYYPDPERFDPDRFEGNNFKPNPTFLPFGDGPRICIAMRFAVMEVKTCLAKILSKYTVKLSPKTEIPLKFKKRAFFPTVEGGIWLNFEKRDQ